MQCYVNSESGWPVLVTFGGPALTLFKNESKNDVRNALTAQIRKLEPKNYLETFKNKNLSLSKLVKVVLDPPPPNITPPGSSRLKKIRNLREREREGAER